MEYRKLSFQTIFADGFTIGIANLASLLGAVVLYLLTIWIPYINVGTTIALSTIPVELSKGHVISPLFIFDGRYRKYMGEYFNLLGLKMMSLYPAFMFLIVPGIIISISWSQALYLMIDKEMSPTDALLASNKMTYGYKWDIFLVGLGICFAAFVVALLMMKIFSGKVLLFFLFVLAVVYMVTNLGCNAVIYRDLSADEASESKSEETTVEA